MVDIEPPEDLDEDAYQRKTLMRPNKYAAIQKLTIAEEFPSGLFDYVGSYRGVIEATINLAALAHVRKRVHEELFLDS